MEIETRWEMASVPQKSVESYKKEINDGSFIIFNDYAAPKNCCHSILMCSGNLVTWAVFIVAGGGKIVIVVVVNRWIPVLSVLIVIHLNVPSE